MGSVKRPDLFVPTQTITDFFVANRPLTNGSFNGHDAIK
jgi:hypothetical protein